ncbi:MAG: hypothetical protein HOY79_04485 [Streptomyces sp.]|nr:hypothetical protein [Streptomyces sp.]NUS15463.1 hypothetical protein [Streptomyces sp.]NUS24079.1 hypothetical protein [Streptomyces sp.]
MKTTTLPAVRLNRPTPPGRPILPRPLWERHQLFQEPVYPDGLGPLEDDEGDEDEAA